MIAIGAQPGTATAGRAGGTNPAWPTFAETHLPAWSLCATLSGGLPRSPEARPQSPWAALQLFDEIALQQLEEVAG